MLQPNNKNSNENVEVFQPLYDKQKYISPTLPLQSGATPSRWTNNPNKSSIIASLIAQNGGTIEKSETPNLLEDLGEFVLCEVGSPTDRAFRAVADVLRRPV